MTSRSMPSTSQAWTELQNTLEEVELNAASGTNIFGAEHSRALEELRNAQVELAKAWARGEEAERQGQNDQDGDDADEHVDKNNIGGGRVTGDQFAFQKRQGKKSQLEEETERDIDLARRRRQANDRYFERVNKGVLDVVARLDVVADKLGTVELESQEIWGDKSDIATPG